MSTFNDGFTSELVKLSGVVGGAAKWVAKKPVTRGIFPALTALLIGKAGYAGMEASKNKKRRIIQAGVRNGRVLPGPMASVDWHNALGIKKKPSRLKLIHNSRNFNRGRERA